MELKVWLLGGFRVHWGGELLHQLKPGKSQLLLSYLLLFRDQPQSRARLASLFWPDSSEDQARTNLRRELHQLRQEAPFAEEFLNTDARQIGWLARRPYWLDVAEFEQAESIQQAIELYSGELLPGYYEDWVLDQRERLARRYRGLLEQQRTQLEVRGLWREALEPARRLVALDPSEEESHRGLIRLHLALGDRAGAHKALLECRRRLREELEVEPSQATLDLLTEPPDSAMRPQLPGAPPLLGRQREMHELRQWDPRQLLLLVGEPGIGKTRLLQELEASTERCLWVRGYEAEKGRPYGPWLDALRGQSQLLSLLQPDTAHRARDLLMDPVVHWLESQSPMLLLLDDLQWFDEASLSLLHYACRVIDRGGIRWAASLRQGEAEQQPVLREFLRGLRRALRLRELVLDPLPLSDIEQLVEWASDSRPGASATPDLPGRCGGNPLFALELAHSGGQALNSCVQERLERLGGVAREVVSLAAALGRAVDPPLLEQGLGRSLHELLPALEELESTRLLVPTEEGYIFRHDVVREAAYQHLSLPRRRLMHLQWARVLEGLPQRWAELARHACLAEDHQRAARACMVAAEKSLRVLAFDECGRFCREGQQQAEKLEASGESLRLQLELYRMEAWTGPSSERAGHMGDKIQQLLLTARGDACLESICYEALSSLAYDQQDDARVEDYSRQLALSAQRSPAVEAARWLAHSGNCLASIGRDLTRAEALLEEAQELSRRSHLELVDLELGWGLLAQHRGHYPKALQHLEHALRLARQRQEHWWRGQCLVALGRLLLEIEDHPAVAVVADELEELAATVGEGSDRVVARAFRALVQQGNASDPALPELERILKELDQLDACRLLAFVARSAAQQCLRQGNVRLALQQSTYALRAARRVNFVSEQVLALALQVESRRLLGELDSAQELLRELRKVARSGELSWVARDAMQRLLLRWGNSGSEPLGASRR